MPGRLEGSKDHKRTFLPIPQEMEDIGKLIVDAAFTVHSKLGPGLLEKVYEISFCHELSKRNLSYERQVKIPIVYSGSPEKLSTEKFLSPLSTLTPVSNARN